MDPRRHFSVERGVTGQDPRDSRLAALEDLRQRDLAACLINRVSKGFERKRPLLIVHHAAIYARANNFGKAACASYSPVHTGAMALQQTITPRAGQIWWQVAERRRVLIVATEIESGWVTVRQCNEWGVVIRGTRPKRERRVWFCNVVGFLFTGFEVTSA